MTSVKLISVTKPVGELSGLTPQNLISYIARVSNPKNQLNNETSANLLKYCIKNKHWSIFESVSMTIEINTSRAIAQQVLRHRSANFQELSQRYQEVTEFVTYPARRQDNKNRQNSIDDMSQEDKDWFQDAQHAIQTNALNLYQEALNRGIAKELARFLLPLSTKTRLYMTNNLRNWIHYIEVRADKSTQLEHRLIALECQKIFKEQFPDIAQALEWI